MRRTRAALMVVVAVVATASCGGGQDVGDEVQVDPGTSVAGCRLGECTTTTPAPTTTKVAPTTTSTAKAASTQRATSTTAPTTTTTTSTTVPSRPSIVVRVQHDTADGGPFDPAEAVVSRNAIVRWTNADSVPRSVAADDGSFRSPMLAPGESFDFRFTAAGRFSYHDGTRPYAIGSVEVS